MAEISGDTAGLAADRRVPRGSGRCFEKLNSHGELKAEPAGFAFFIGKHETPELAHRRFVF